MLYRFADFALDTDRRELRLGLQRVVIAPQVFDILEYLLRNRHRIVSKDDLIAAIWDGRLVSESAVTTRMNAVRRAIGDTGKDQRLIRTLPRKGVRFVGIVHEAQEPKAPTAEGANEQPRPALTLSNRPSIAVMPFANMSDDPQQDYLADGIVEEIIRALSRLHWLFVIAHNSSFIYKCRPIDVRQVGRELGARYVLEGSVRKAVSHVRIAGQLIDTLTGAYIWADHFDHIFDLQDQVAASVVGAIALKMEQAEIERVRRKPTANLEAYDYYLRGMARIVQVTKDVRTNGDTLRLFYKAIELDLNFASAYGMAAYCYGWRKMNGWMADRPKEIAETTRLALQAVELGKDDAVALTMGGWALAFVVGEAEAGADFIERALILNPNLAAGRLLSGMANLYLGKPDVTIERATRAYRLNPLDPFTFLLADQIGTGHLFAGRYDEASSCAEKGLWLQTNSAGSARVAAASHALAGRLDHAQKAMMRMRQIDPAIRVSDLSHMLPFRRQEDIARYEEGLRIAGMPK